THHAGFQRHHQCVTVQPPGPGGLGGSPQDQQFGMGGGVVQLLPAVVIAGDHLALGADDHRPHRDVIVAEGGPSLLEGDLHVGGVIHSVWGSCSATILLSRLPRVAPFSTSEFPLGCERYPPSTTTQDSSWRDRLVWS